MGRCEKLLDKARRNPSGLRFRELIHLCECHGFVFSRHAGSHRIQKHRGLRRSIALQGARGMAKAYQVRQLLEMIEDSEGTHG